MQVSDDFLIQKIQKGDKAAFEQLFRNYYAQLCSYAQSYVKNPQVAEDQVQEVFVNIWEQKEDWNPQGTIKSYLYKAVRNQSLNYLKHVKVVEEWKQKKVSIQTPSPFPPTEKRVHPEEVKKWVQEAIRMLPEKRRTIYELSRDHGLTYLEISKALNISVKTVETQMGRSLKHLRSWLKDKIE
ncbi:MAG: RNA polymerase sigma-70 factor [Candidatus Halalkalibacterium sp. M3_1C_030]|jgi:RNA polymerase sigma-70 factor (ECF subfamily)